jgi:hypothetical protein
MSRVALVLVLIISFIGPLAAGPPLLRVDAQEATPSPINNPLVGTWIVQELLPPSGGPPVTAGVATIFADGNVLLSGFGDGQAAMQGAWSAAGDRSATLTVVALLIDQSGTSDGTLRRVRAAVEVNAAGDELEGGYTFEVIAPDGNVQFTYNGPIGGTRVKIEPPDPIALTLRPATPAAGTPAP